MINPVDVIASVACPIFFIQEEHDNAIPAEDARRLLQASSGTENELWIVPNAEHSQGYRTMPSEYVEKISNFFISNTKWKMLLHTTNLPPLVRALDIAEW